MAAQVAVISGQVNYNGFPVASAAIRVCSVTSTGTPCTPTTAIYQDYNLSIALPNPTAADQYGNFTVYVPALSSPNLYIVQVTPSTGITWSYVYDGAYLSASGGTITGNLILTGNLTVGGTATSTIFNATTSPYYEVNGVQIACANLSDCSNLAKINAGNVFTGSPQTAPVFNATTQFDVNGVQIASSNLSDSANLARLNASNTFTGTTNTFSGITGTTINATTGFQVGGVALSASNLSNGVSGTGAVCLASGSVCAASTGTVTSVGVTVPAQMTVTGSPVTTAGTIALGLHTTGTETDVVTAAGAGTSGQFACWDASGGINGSTTACASSGQDEYGTLPGCTFPNDGGGLNCVPGTITWPTAFSNTSYTVGCWPMYSAAIAGGSSTQPVIDLNATINTSSQITLTEGVAQGSSGGFAVSTSYGLTIVCHAHHS